MPAADPNRTPRPAPAAAGHLPLALLRQYAAGTLAPADQHRVEAHTLACARCADVLAGLTITDAPTTDRAVARLRQRLHARVAAEETAAPAAWAWGRLAAVILLLVLSTVAFFQLRPTKEVATSPQPVAAVVEPAAAPAPLAEMEGAAAPPPPAAAVPEATPPQPAPTSPPAVAAAPTPPQRLGQAAPPGRIAAESSSPTIAPPEKAVGLDGVAATTSATSDTLPGTMTSAVAPATAPSRVAARAKVAVVSADSRESTVFARPAAGVPAGSRRVRGRVTEPGGQPLPGVSVLVPGTRYGTSTAADGTFTLPVAADATRLSFSSIGFLQQEKKLGRDTTAQVVLTLTPDTRALSEVVVTKRGRVPAPAALPPLPTGGYPAWNQYLRDSLQYPDKALEERREGTVRLRFTVKATGQLEKIEVVRGVSKELDEEAIRLLRAGPAWHPAIQNGRPAAQTVKVDVPFEVRW